MLDLDSLRRDRLNSKANQSDKVAVMKIATKKVAVRPEDLVKLPDGTVIVKDKRK